MSNSGTPTWRAENAGPQHQPAIRSLFQSVFGQPMSDSHWHWKYGNGRGLGVVVLGGQDLVAFFGGTERRVMFNDQPLVAMQCGDSMVLPSQRGILTRKGPFYLSVTSFLGQYVGAGLPYLLSYGFPNARAMRLAQRLALYDDVGAMLEIDWHPLGSSPFQAQTLDFDAIEHHQLVDTLWKRMVAGFSGRAIGIRDFAYIRQRFFDNPTLDYQFDLVSSTGSEEVIGLLITRHTGTDLLLVDMVAKKENLQYLVNFARYRAAQLNCGKLYGWLTEVDRDLIEATDPVIEKPPLRLPLGVYSPGLSADEVRDKWFFLCGDSDFL
ncbi:MAG: hypothetical protein R3F41_03170 [Gammaproteobacteria bacterium]|nr:hypothetical protein [Pseudomonadales bacterium]MCP5345705.1 hypothetical protein [Pseudomonadales bacterium]